MENKKVEINVEYIERLQWYIARVEETAGKDINVRGLMGYLSVLQESIKKQ